MTVNQAITTLVEHRNNYTCYTAEALEEAKLTLKKTGYDFKWHQDETGFWFLEARIEGDKQ